MTITTKFDVGDWVLIKDSNIIRKIASISITEKQRITYYTYHDGESYDHTESELTKMVEAE